MMKPAQFEPIEQPLPEQELKHICCVFERCVFAIQNNLKSVSDCPTDCMFHIIRFSPYTAPPIQDTTGLTENQILCRNVTIGVKEARKEFLIRQDEREGREIAEEWKRREIQSFLSMRTTKELVEELAKREGVKEIVVQPYEWYQVSGEKEQWDHGLGPARILVVVD